mgnify:CR=1 FL=1
MSEHDEKGMEMETEEEVMLPGDTVEFSEDEKDDEEQEAQLKDRYAIGLEMDPGTGLPRVTSIGRGLIAQQMIKKAREAGVPVESDRAALEKIYRPADDRVIPSRTYVLIAEILTFIYRLNEAYSKEAPDEFMKATAEADKARNENLSEIIAEAETIGENKA